MDAMERANHLMDTAEFESVIVFDRCAVVLAQLETGEIVMEACGSQTAEEFDAEKAVETCMIGIHGRLMEMLSAQKIEPAEPMLTKQQAEMIVALANNGMKPNDVAKAMGCHRSTVYNRIEKIREATGKDPLDFFGMAELLVEARQVLEV